MRWRPYRRTKPAFPDLLALHEAAYGTAQADVEVEDMVGYLDYLAGTGRFAFHGTGVPGLEILTGVRQSTDTRAFGRQDAVYATPDPHWAAFFAVVDRSNARSIRNGSVAFSASAGTRWYRRDVLPVDPARPILCLGWLHVLPRETFRAEPPLAGFLDTAQWVSDEPVRPVFSLQLDPQRYRLARHIRVVPR